MYLTRKSLGTVVLLIALLSQIACKNFSQELRIVLAASPPLIQSLPLSPALKNGLVQDFTDMASDTATLSDCLQGASAKPAKLVCVSTYEGSVEAIIQRGHFGQANNQKLNTVLGILRGIMASARVYYGGESPASITAAARAKPVTEDSLNAQIKALKEAMKPCHLAYQMRSRA